MTSPAAAIAPLGVPRAQIKKKKRVGFRPVKKVGAKLSKPLKSSIENELPSSAKDSSVAEPSKEKKTAESRVIPSPKPASRKRKQFTSISVGFVRNAEDAKIQATAAQEESSSPEAPPDGTSAIVVATPEPANQDRDIIARLRAENPDEVRLSSFCSSFKGPKREQPENQRAAAPPPRANNPQPSQTTKKSTAESSGAPVVQIIDGEIVLQESSLQVPGQRRTVEEVEAEYHDVVEEDATLGIVGASINSFVNRKGPQHWSVDETKRFYEALRQLGPDFGCMEAFFENRTRKQLKRKYQAEMTRNSKLVEMALDPKYQTDIDLSVFNVEVDPKAIEAAANEEPPKYEPTDVEPQDGTNEGKKKSQGQWEEVVENAEEERAAAALQQPSIWGDEEENHEPEIDFPEPSMEEFFPDKEEETAVADPVMETPAEPEATSISISLVPKKTNAKSKRPKFRSAARKRK